MVRRRIHEHLVLYRTPLLGRENVLSFINGAENGPLFSRLPLIPRRDVLLFLLLTTGHRNFFARLALIDPHSMHSVLRLLFLPFIERPHDGHNVELPSIPLDRNPLSRPLLRSAL